jgi:hypothetical protein
VDKRGTRTVNAQIEWKTGQEQASTEEAHRLADRSIRSANLATRLAAFSLQLNRFHPLDLCRCRWQRSCGGRFGVSIGGFNDVRKKRRGLADRG